MTWRWRLGTASSLMSLIMAHLIVVIVMVTTGASRYQHQPDCLAFGCPGLKPSLSLSGPGSCNIVARSSSAASPSCRWRTSSPSRASMRFFVPGGGRGRFWSKGREKSATTISSSRISGSSGIRGGLFNVNEGASSTRAGGASGSLGLLDGLEEDLTSQRRAYAGISSSYKNDVLGVGGKVAPIRWPRQAPPGSRAGARARELSEATAAAVEQAEECEVLWYGTRVAVGPERRRVAAGGEKVAAAGAGRKAELWFKPVMDKRGAGAQEGRFRVVVAGQNDIDEAGALCIKVFFGEADSPWKAAQLRQLAGEQRQDLESRCNREESVMFKAIDTWRNDKMVGFIEVSAVPGSKYGMGSGVPLSDTRPVVSNLAVDRESRRCGIGTALMDACEDMIHTWGFEEIILQVEEDNEAALSFYEGMGFVPLFVDRAARRYDTSGFLLQNVRTSKVTMRKALSPSTVGTRPTQSYSLGDQLAQLLTFVMKPFVTRPHPASISPAARRRGGAETMESLFGTPGAGRSSSPPETMTAKGRGSSSSPESPPSVVRLHRTR